MVNHLQSPMLSTCTSLANWATTSTVKIHKTLDAHMPRWQIILPAASARSRLSPLMTKKKCRSWTKPSTSLDSSGAYNCSAKCKGNHSQISRDEKIDVYRVTSCCMVLSQLEFQVHTVPICKKNHANPPGHGWGCFPQIAGWWRENQLNPQLLRQRRRHLWRFHQPQIQGQYNTLKVSSWNEIMLQVGTEWVCKTQNTNSCEVGTGSIIKNVYGRLFRYIVDMCNNTLM